MYDEEFIILPSCSTSSISSGKWYFEYEKTEYKPPEGFDLWMNCPICDMIKHREPQEDFIKESEMTV